MAVPRDIRHIPVLLNPVLEILSPHPGDTIVDCTLGLAGHAAEILRLIAPTGRLIGLDFDPRNIELARATLTGISPNFSLHHANFAGLPAILAREGITKIDGLLADVGVASPQIDNPGRGFSYRNPGPLDMRMDPTRGQAAAHLVNTLSQEDLARAFRELGDEEDADAIASLIVQRRRRSPITTTEALTAIVCEARHFTLQRAAGARLHPAARTFQALRMLVNRELPNLQRLLDILPAILSPGRCAAVISFHSGEDRLVKRAFKLGLDRGDYAEISPNPITATAAEQSQNPRSRSAKLRFARAAGGVIGQDQFGEAARTRR